MIPTLYEPFRHWSESGSVYILSDLHFDDADCKFMSPDWIIPQEQISITNGMVMKNDTFICLAGEEYHLEEVVDKAGDRFEKPGEVYSEELIYWVGYIYQYWHYVTGESSKEIYKQMPVKVMSHNYARLYIMTLLHQ